jgi:hypothetical protein
MYLMVTMMHWVQILWKPGYDLLDKLSRRRQYVRSHVKERTCVMAFEPVQSYSDSDVEDLKISGCGWVVCENLANFVVFDIFLMAQKYIKIDSFELCILSLMHTNVNIPTILTHIISP